MLASFGQKIGSTSGGHYIAYRREGINWYEINDGRVTPKGKQGLNEPIMPQEIKSKNHTAQNKTIKKIDGIKKLAEKDDIRNPMPQKANMKKHVAQNMTIQKL